MTTTDLDHAVPDALRYGADHALADTIDLGHDQILVRKRVGLGSESWEKYDTSDPHPENPRRLRGTVNVYDADSFVAAIQQRVLDGGAVVYADEEKRALVGILNDDSIDYPGWRDATVSLVLRETPEWSRWKAGSGQLGEQEVFALRIEDGAPEIVEPPAAVMLDIAQSFRATNEVKFKQAGRLANGETQFMYDENIQASAGAGNVSIPEAFTLGVIPFIGGGQAYEITARLRYTLRGGELKIGYQLVRPEDVERDAFNAVLADVTDLMDGTTFLRGPAPAKAS